MILGKIVGKISTTGFKFLVKEEAKKYQYLQVLDEAGHYILAQVVELERDSEKTIAECIVIGYKEDGVLKRLRVPLAPSSEVLKADNDFIKETLGLEQRENFGYIGKLEGRDLKVYLDLNKALTRHVCVLAKSGYGKSYTVGVLLEELLEKKIPLVVIDPHGEYSALKYPNEKDKEKLIEFDVKAKGFLEQIQEFSPNVEDNIDARPLKLNSANLDSYELVHLLPAKLNNSQLSALYAAMQNLDNLNFDALILELESIDNAAKWTLMDVLGYIKKLDLFSENFTSVHELVKPGKATIINLRGVPKEVQEVVVYKLASDLFNARKKELIPPFFLILEEAHNYIPERSFGEAKSSGILRQIFAEGRKFGLGACLISQRPSRVDKSAISQCTTQIILKVTNPNDVKAIVNSVEGITHETEKEIVNLPIGTAMVVGVVDMPLFVNIRPRKSKHGGETIRIVQEQEKDFIEQSEKFGDEELLPIVQEVSLKDYKLMNDKEKVDVSLIPCGFYSFEDFNLLVNLVNGEIVKDLSDGRGVSLYKGIELSPKEQKFFNMVLKLKEFSVSELFAKSQAQFSEIYEIVKSLKEKKLLEQQGNRFRVNKKFDLNLKENAFYGKIEFKSIDGRKLNVNYDLNEVVSKLNELGNVKEKRECFLVVYS